MPGPVHRRHRGDRGLPANVLAGLDRQLLRDVGAGRDPERCTLPGHRSRPFRCGYGGSRRGFARSRSARLPGAARSPGFRRDAGSFISMGYGLLASDLQSLTSDPERRHPMKRPIIAIIAACSSYSWAAAARLAPLLRQPLSSRRRRRSRRRQRSLTGILGGRSVTRHVGFRAGRSGQLRRRSGGPGLLGQPARSEPIDVHPQ